MYVCMYVYPHVWKRRFLNLERQGHHFPVIVFCCCFIKKLRPEPLGLPVSDSTKNLTFRSQEYCFGSLDMERMLNEWKPIARFESQHNKRGACEESFWCFWGRYDRQRPLAIRIAAITLASDSAIIFARFRPSKFWKRELTEFCEELGEFCRKKTRWVRLGTQKTGWEELTELSPRNSARAKKLTELSVWNRSLAKPWKIGQNYTKNTENCIFWVVFMYFCPILRASVFSYPVGGQVFPNRSLRNRIRPVSEHCKDKNIGYVSYR